MRFIPSAFCSSGLLLVTACGETNQNTALNLQEKYFEVALGVSTGKGGRAGGGEGLGLLSGKDIQIKYSVSGCKSGFKKNVSEFVTVSNLALRFYRGDSGCLVRLDAIRLQASGKTGYSDYAIAAGSPESSFAVAGPSPASQSKIYLNSANQSQLLLVNDISFDMQKTSSLEFKFQSVSGDLATKAIANVATTQALGSSALEAPNFEIPFDPKSPDSPNMGLSLSSMGAVYAAGSAGSVEANGGFQIDVLMRCAKNVSLGTAGAVNTTANCPTPAGDAMKVHDLQLAVVMCRSKDDRLTYAEAAALFSATPSSRVMSAPSALVPVIKSGVNFSSQASSDFVTGLRYKGVKTHFPAAAISGTAVDKGCAFDQSSQAKGWMILRKTEGSGSSQVSSYQVTNIELSASTYAASIAAAMKEEVKIFDYTGSLESFKIPAGVTSVEIKAWGGGGCVFDETPNYAASHNADFGGAGGFSSAKISVKPDEILYIQVAQGGQKYGSASGGYPNGGDGFNGGCAGGGSSNVFVNGYGSQDKLLLVAGGGGGAGWYTPSGSSRQGNGAAGGGLISQSGSANPGAGGNQSQGGQIGNGKGLALKGGSSSGNGGTGGPGAGGGGYFGGASGVGGNNNTNGGGGGGSCYVGLASDGKALASNAGEGDAKDYIDAAGTTRTVGGRTYSAAECLSGNGKNPPKKSDADYVAGIAMGGEIANVAQVPGWSVNHKIAKGGNGRVVLRYMVPVTASSTGSTAQSSSNSGKSVPTALGGFYSATILNAYSGAGNVGSYGGFTSGNGSGGANGFRFSAPDASINYYSELRIDNSNWNNSHGFVGVVDETHWSNSPHWGGSTGARLMYYLGNNFSYGTQTGSVQDPNIDHNSGTFVSGDILGLVVHQKQGIVKYYKNGKHFATISNTKAANTKLFIAVEDWYYKKSLAATMLTSPSQYASSYTYDAPFVSAQSEDFYKDSAGRILILSAATAGKDPRTLTKTTGKVLPGTDSCIDDARWQKFIELAKTQNYRVSATLDGSTKPVTKASDWNLKKMINANQVKLKTSLTDWHLIPYAYTLYVLAWDETSGATVTGGDYSLWSWGGTSYYYGYYGQSSNSFFDQTTYSNQTANWWILPPGVPDFP